LFDQEPFLHPGRKHHDVPRAAAVRDCASNREAAPTGVSDDY